MLTRIDIRNFAIIEQLSVELQPGLCALTGETGAGKSILIDALNLALGDRASAEVIRTGATRTEISVEFDIADSPAAHSWLAEHSLDDDGLCQLRRTVESERGSKAFINGRSVNTQNLRELGELLVDIHGQHEHQFLLRRDAQRALLDDLAGHTEQLSALRETYRDWQKTRQQLTELTQADTDREARRDLLQHQVQELEALDLSPGEPERLAIEHKRQAHVEHVLQQGQQALAMSYEGEEHNAHALASHAARVAEELCDFDPGLAEAQELFANATIQLQEGADLLRRQLSALEVDPERLAWLDRRLSAIHQLARKHRVDPDALPDRLQAFQDELNALDQSGSQQLKLQKNLEALQSKYLAQATELSQRRTQCAERFSQEVTTVMRTLGMVNGQLAVRVDHDPEADFAPNGLDRITFEIGMNPGQPLRPLAKVASGGELSRISLAIQVVAAHHNPIRCMIFDEVDTGIGGGVAEIVGRRLRQISNNRQVLCVTHLPQVAAYATQHFRVSKNADQDSTTTTIEALKPTERVEELARMLGGIQITDTTRAHAKELMANASQA